MPRGGYRPGSGIKKGSKKRPSGQFTISKIKMLFRLVRVLKKLCKTKEIALLRQDGTKCQCEWCGKEWNSEIKKGIKKYCSDECRKQARKKMGELSRKWQNNTCEECGKVFRTQNDSKYCSGECWGKVCSRAHISKRITYHCRKCGQEFTRVKRTTDNGDPVYCSRACSGNGEVGKPATKVYERNGNHRHRAKFYGVDYVHVKITDVFNKHNWTCQICGCYTPKVMRGSKHNNAPEIDHIIPLSRGGSHVEVNLQCACRKCNSQKGNSI